MHESVKRIPDSHSNVQEETLCPVCGKRVLVRIDGDGDRYSEEHCVVDGGESVV